MFKYIFFQNLLSILKSFRVRCDNNFVGIYREHMSKVKSKIVLGNKKSLDINIIPTLIDPTFGTGLYSFQNISEKVWIMIILFIFAGDHLICM